MIIKSKSRKNASFLQLYNYMLKGAKDKTLIISKNLYKTDNRTEIIKQYYKNYALLPKRKNGNTLYHEVIALPSQDQAKLTKTKQKEILHDLANTYLEKRTGLNLCFGIIHEETDNIHCHLMISSNEKNSDKRQRLSKQQLYQIQQEVENYKQEKYPELKDKPLYNQPRYKTKVKVTDQEYQFKKRTRQASNNDKLKEDIKKLFTKSLTQKELEDKLNQQGLEFYNYRNKTNGIRDKNTGRKHRFRTLGILELYQSKMKSFTWQRHQAKQIDQIYQNKENKKELENPMRSPLTSKFTSQMLLGNDSATMKQLEYLKKHKLNIPLLLSKEKAIKLIEEHKQAPSQVQLRLVKENHIPIPENATKEDIKDLLFDHFTEQKNENQKRQQAQYTNKKLESTRKDITTSVKSLTNQNLATEKQQAILRQNNIPTNGISKDQVSQMIEAIFERKQKQREQERYQDNNNRER